MRHRQPSRTVTGTWRDPEYLAFIIHTAVGLWYAIDHADSVIPASGRLSIR